MLIKKILFLTKFKADKLEGSGLHEPWSTEAKKNFRGIAYGIRINGEVVTVRSVENIVEWIGSGGASIITDPEYQGKGYATSALSYAVKDALNRIPIVTYPVESNNIAAIRVLEKLGFRFHSSFLYTEAVKKK